MPTVTIQNDSLYRDRLKQVLDTGSFYQKFDWPWNLFPEQLPQVTIQSFCDTCDSERSFVQSSEWENSRVARRGTFVFGHSFFGTFRCSDCKTPSHSFTVHFEHRGTSQKIFKVGQFPSPRPEIPKSIRQLGDEPTKLFSKGLLCEVHGLGIGSSAYYRRIIEDTINKFIEAIIELADAQNEETIIEALVKAKVEKQFSEKLKGISEHLPTSLSRGEANPIGTLFGLLSEGVHNMSDEESLRWSTDVRELTQYVLAELQDKKESSLKTKEILTRMRSRDKSDA